MIRILAFTALVLAAWPSQAARAAEMTFYQLPAGAYPHDVAPAPDGTVWISGQRQGFAGRFDPKTGHLEKIALGPGAAPHGVIVGPDGNAWLTEGGQNAIARVDARTKEVKLFPLPKEFPNANLNTLVFDGKGTALVSPVRTAFTAGSIPQPAKWTPGRRRRAAAPTASP